MSRAWVCVATVVMVAVLGGGCEGFTVRPELLGLLQAQEIQTQLDLIDTLLGKLVNGSDCKDLKQTKEKDAAEEGTEMESEDEVTTVASEDEVTTVAPEDEEEKAKEEEEEEEEECDYEEISEGHTMLLPPNDDCKVTNTSVTDDEKDLILTLHNELRSIVALGNETRGDPGPQPPAANMHQLIWNEELAKVAQAWAAQCPTGHDNVKNRGLCSRKYRTGQNINYYWGVLDEGPKWEKAIYNWYNEVKDVDAKLAAVFFPQSDKKIGHYTQLIWGTSKEIGCGIVYYETERKGILYTNSITHVCNYGPSGNVVSRPLYKHGPAASDCPGEVSAEYPSLCI